MVHRSGPHRSNRLARNGANCRCRIVHHRRSAKGDGDEERDCRLAKPIAVWSNAPQRCNDRAFRGYGGGKGWRKRHNCIGGKSAGPGAGALVAGHRPSAFSSVGLNAGSSGRKQQDLLPGGSRHNRSSVLFSGQSAGITRGSSIWHRLGPTLKRRALSIS
jgi:hypothetical protein